MPDFFKIGKYTVLVDPEDFEKLSSIKWSVVYNRNKPYAMRGSRLQMHRVILGLKHGDGTIVDHINRNSLDNRKSNLRIATPRVNALNSDRCINSKMIHKKHNRFVIDTTINRERFYASLSSFEEALEVLRAIRNA